MTINIISINEEIEKELQNYPDHWRPTLRRLAKEGESVSEIWEELKDLDNLM